MQCILFSFYFECAYIPFIGSCMSNCCSLLIFIQVFKKKKKRSKEIKCKNEIWASFFSREKKTHTVEMHWINAVLPKLNAKKHICIKRVLKWIMMIRQQQQQQIICRRKILMCVSARYRTVCSIHVWHNFMLNLRVSSSTHWVFFVVRFVISICANSSKWWNQKNIYK